MVAENKPNHISLLASEALGFITSGKVFPEFIFGRLGYDNRLQIHGRGPFRSGNQRKWAIPLIDYDNRFLEDLKGLTGKRVVFQPKSSSPSILSRASSNFSGVS
jgi:hypothetical protein